MTDPDVPEFKGHFPQSFGWAIDREAGSKSHCTAAEDGKFSSLLHLGLIVMRNCKSHREVAFKK